MIIVLPHRRESIGESVRRWQALGYSLSSVKGRIVAMPISNAVSMRRRTSAVESIFQFAQRENE